MNEMPDSARVAAGPASGGTWRIFLFNFFAWLVLVPSVVVGLATVYAAWRAHGQARADAPLIALAGITFTAVGLGGILLVRWMSKRMAEHAALQAAAPEEPWKWRPGLLPGSRTSSSGTLAVILWAFALFWLLMIGGITVGVRDKLGQERGLLAVVLAFWAAGLFLLSMAIQTTLHRRKFGHSMLELDRTPAVLGGYLSGVIRAPLALQPAARVELMVECVRRVRGIGRDSHDRVDHLWREVALLDTAALERGADHVAVPVSLQLPVEGVLPTSEPAPGTSVTWWLRISAELPGVDYGEAFELPVAPRGASASLEAPLRTMPEASADVRPPSSPLRIEMHPGGGTVVFPFPTWFPFWTVLPVLTAAAAGYFQDHPLLQGLPFAPVTWAWCIAGGLVALSLVGVALTPRRLEVGPDLVRLRRGLLGVGFHLSVPRNAITGVDDAACTGEPVSYKVQLLTRGGKAFEVTSLLRDPAEAKWLAAELGRMLACP